MGEQEEASPDIEVVITIRKAGKIGNSVEISINKGRFVRELKQSLAVIPEIGIHPQAMKIYVGDVEMANHLKILNYDVETDDELFLDDFTGMI